MSEADKVGAVAQELLERIPSLADCRVGVVLGSGLGSFADALEDVEVVSYDQVEHLPQTGVPGHLGRLLVGSLAGRRIAVLQGRVHLYEGHGAHVVVRAVRSLGTAGISNLILTNAAGAIRGGLSIGDLVLLTDHINLSGANPMVGVTDDRLGQRFIDTSDLYSADLRERLKEACSQEGIALREGVYATLLGPSYETPAEIRMFGAQGVDLVGMSTVLEAIAAHALGVRVTGLSFVTNIAAGLGGGILSHGEVTEAATAVEADLTLTLGILVRTLHDHGRAES